MNFFNITNKFQKMIYLYLFIFIFLGIYFISKVPVNFVAGEYDDYTLMTASMMYDKNYTISSKDVEYARKMFPDISEPLKNYSLSGYYTKNGDGIAWYAPTYSIFAIPFVIICKLIRISTSYSFRIANLSIYIFLLYWVFRKKNKVLSPKYKFTMMILLTVHPIFLLLKWNSAEIFIYSLLGMSVVSWFNKEYYKSAIFAALSASLNIVIFLWCFILFCDYFIKIMNENKKVFNYAILKKIIRYSSCYIVAILPYLFNYYHTKHFNLPAAFMTDFRLKNILERMMAYWFDLNLGFFPYMSVVLVLSIVIFVNAIKKREYKYVILFITALGISFGYSIASHINSGMEEMARYNTWNSIFLISIVIYRLNEHKKNRFIDIFLIIGIFISAIVVVKSSKNDYAEMLPFATKVLDNVPELYSPLKSTFNSRVSHIDGGYDYVTPIIYYDKNGDARKILVDPKGVDKVKDTLTGNFKDITWLNEKLKKIRKEEYISINKFHKLFEGREYKLEDKIFLSTNNWNANKYITSGISGNEKTFTWSDGNEITLKKLKVKNITRKKDLIMEIETDRTYNGYQKIEFFSNNKKINEKIVNGNEKFEIPISTDENGVINIKMILPNAISPLEKKESEDGRKLAVGFKSILFKSK